MRLRHLGALDLAIASGRSGTIDNSEPLRPCQRAYLGESSARRILRRAQLTKKIEHGEPIFAVHEEAAIAAAATPFQASPKNVGNKVQCYATHAEDEKKRKGDQAIEKEKMALFNSINGARQAENVHKLGFKPLLAEYAQDHADMLYSEEHCSSNPSPASTNSVVVVMAPSGARVARLVSPPKIGALSCGEMWYGGKYKRHLYSMATDNVTTHPDDCPCHLRIVFETMVDEGWNSIGVGRGEDGRWVVELGQ